MATSRSPQVQATRSDMAASHHDADDGEDDYSDDAQRAADSDSDVEADVDVDNDDHEADEGEVRGDAEVDVDADVDVDAASEDDDNDEDGDGPDDSGDGEDDAEDDELATNSPNNKTPLHSWRKKYYKIRAQFGNVMKQSNDLYCSQHRALALAQRLQEDNDQLRELLLDLSQHERLPESQQIDLSSPDLDDLEFLGIDESDVQRFLAVTVAADNTPAITTTSTITAPSDPLILSFLGPDREATFLRDLDNSLSNEPPIDLSTTNRPATTSARYLSSAVLSDKELALRNPASVLNWLRRHQPEVFLSTDGKAAANGGTTASATIPIESAGAGVGGLNGTTVEKAPRATRARRSVANTSNNGGGGNHNTSNGNGRADEDVAASLSPPPAPAPKPKGSRRKSTKEDTPAGPREGRRQSGTPRPRTTVTSGSAEAETTVLEMGTPTTATKVSKPRKRKRETDVSIAGGAGGEQDHEHQGGVREPPVKVSRSKSSKAVSGGRASGGIKDH